MGRSKVHHFHWSCMSLDRLRENEHGQRIWKNTRKSSHEDSHLPDAQCGSCMSCSFSAYQMYRTITHKCSTKILWTITKHAMYIIDYDGEWRSLGQVVKKQEHHVYWRRKGGIRFRCNIWRGDSGMGRSLWRHALSIWCIPDPETALRCNVPRPPSPLPGSLALCYILPPFSLRFWL